jgi:hypothetical protein
MTVCRSMAARGLALAAILLALGVAVASGPAARAQGNAPPAQARPAQGIIGKWSGEQTCSAQSRQIIFRGNTMELWEASQRLFTGNVRFQTAGNETAVTVLSIARGSPQLPGNPEVGDIAAFRRDGNLMYPVSVTRNGQRRTAPSDAPPFYLCP